MSYHRIKKELAETFSLNSAEAFDKFVDKKIYRLLGNDVKNPNVKGIDIKSSIPDTFEDVWFIYIVPFLINQDKVLLPLTKKEKRIIEWVKKLKLQDVTNNTPKESVIIRVVLDNV